MDRRSTSKRNGRQDAGGLAGLRHDLDYHYKRLAGFGLLTSVFQRGIPAFRKRVEESCSATRRRPKPPGVLSVAKFRNWGWMRPDAI